MNFSHSPGILHICFVRLAQPLGTHKQAAHKHHRRQAGHGKPLPAGFAQGAEQAAAQKHAGKHRSRPGIGQCQDAELCPNPQDQQNPLPELLPFSPAHQADADADHQKGSADIGVAHGGKTGAVPVDGILQKSGNQTAQQHQSIQHQQDAKPQVQAQNPFETLPPFAVAGGAGKGQAHSVSAEKRADIAGLHPLDPVKCLGRRKPGQKNHAEDQMPSGLSGYPAAEGGSQEQHRRNHRVAFHPGPGHAVAPMLDQKVAA